jgi:hypothetical protein
MTHEHEDQEEAKYGLALKVIKRIPDPEYQTAAIDGIIACRLRNERSYPDSALGMRLRRQAMGLTGDH